VSSKIVSPKSTDGLRSTKHDQRYPLEVEDPSELAMLPPDQVFTGQQLAMWPGQTLAQKARELGVTPQTL
jgi:hypothetical protein